MQIINSGKLNANNYSEISIDKNINVFGPKPKAQLRVSDELTKTLKGKPDQEKQEEIIRYFLRNHKISRVYEDKYEITI